MMGMVDTSGLGGKPAELFPLQPADCVIDLREPKSPPEHAHAARCAGRIGRVVSRGAQDTVRCSTCDTFLYNAPRVETGRAVRTTKTVHNGIKNKQRARVLLRANGACELCHEGGKPIHVGHLVSVDKGLAQGLTELELNDDENLCAMCDECNLGLGKEPVPLRFAVSIVMARLRKTGGGA